MSQRGIIQSAFDQLCRKMAELDRHAACYCQDKKGDCFSTLCNGDPEHPLNVVCYGSNSGACSKVGRAPCAAGLQTGQEIIICPSFWTPKCEAAHCVLIHEILHVCGVTAHAGANCFRLGSIFKSCGPRPTIATL